MSTVTLSPAKSTLIGNPLKSGHLCTTATILGPQGWLLYAGLTVITKFSFPMLVDNFNIIITKFSANLLISIAILGWSTSLKQSSPSLQKGAFETPSLDDDDEPSYRRIFLFFYINVFWYKTVVFRP